MKSKLISVIVGLASFVAIGQVSQDKNYILHKIYKQPVQVGAESPSDEKSEAVYYLDGHGRVVQQTAINGGGNNEDVTVYQDFDNFNRQSKKYLPYAKPNNNGTYIDHFVTEAATFYNSQKYGYTLNPYTEIVFNETRLNALTEIANPGNAWKLADGHTKKVVIAANVTDEVRRYVVGYSSGNEPQLLYYGYYKAGELTKEIYKNENWKLADQNSNTTQIFKDAKGRKILMRNFLNNVAKDTYYVYDDHGNVVYMIPPVVQHSQLFTGTPVVDYLYDNMTQVLNMSTPGISQSFLGTTGSGAITINITNDVLTLNFDITSPVTTVQFNSQTPYINTNIPLPFLFVGDLDAGYYRQNLIKVVLNPACNCINFKQIFPQNEVTELKETFIIQLNPYPDVTPVTANQSVLDKLCYQYKYDGKNRQAEKKLPGVSPQYTVYDIHNRPVLTQNSYQRDWTISWLFTKYDEMGRVAYNGVLSDYYYPTLTQQAMQAEVNSWSTFEARSSVPVNISGDNVYYTNSWPNSLYLKEIYYYDNYSFDLDGLAIPATTSYQDVLITNTKGLLTGSKSRPGDELSLSSTLYGYDRFDRMLYSTSKNPYLSTQDATEAKVDFTGKVLETKTIHNKTGVTTNLISYDYLMYDHADRLIRHTKKTGNSATELITFNKYDELGNLEEKKVGRGVTATTMTGINRFGRNYTKSASNSWTNASLQSTVPLIANGNMSFRTRTGTYDMRLGLSYSPSTTTYTQINYAIALTSTNAFGGGKAAQVYENGVIKTSFTYQPNEEYIIERIGTNIYYKRNGVVFYQSQMEATTQNLYADAHIYTVNTGFADLQINNYTYANAVALETVKYKFNIQGNLTKINDPQISTAGLFNMEIKYTDPENNNPYYNGNVSEIDWRTTNDPVGVKRKYSFSYDHLHRVTTASFKKKNGVTPLASGTYDEYITYDDNGNIQSAKRYGTNDSSPALIDDLSYTYDGNQLIAANDATGNTEGFSNGANLATEYTYDNDGNLTSDANKGITHIAYNDYNLPTVIQFTGTSRYIEFLYDSKGNKLSKKVSSGGNVTLTEYAGNYVYVKVNSNPSELQYIAQPEGYVSHVGAGNFQYVYQYRDHLGNIRLSYTDSDMNGVATVADIIEENNFYPFGLKHKGYNNVYNSLLGGNAYNKYAFQGQEMLEDLGLNWNSFAWRNYDPALGRFFSIDPLAEKYSFMSPYQFSSNQPVHAPELEGMESADHEYDYWENDYDPHEYDWQTYNVWGYSVLNEDETEQIITPTSYISEITIEAKAVPREWSWGIDRNDIMDIVSIAPGGGLIDMYRGARDGDWLQFTLGAGSLVLDIATMGGASVIKAAAVTTVAVAAGYGARALAKRAGKEVVEAAAKEGMTNLQLLTKAAQKAEKKIDEIGRFAGIAKHTYANNLLSRYQSIYGNKGLQFNHYFNGPVGRGFLDVVNHQTMTIYDYKFGSAVMSKSQFLKYSNSFPGYSIQIIRP